MTSQHQPFRAVAVFVAMTCLHLSPKHYTAAAFAPQESRRFQHVESLFATTTATTINKTAPSRRKVRRQEFFKSRQWKIQQAVEKKEEQEEQEGDQISDSTGNNKLVNAVGLSVTDLLQKGSSSEQVLSHKTQTNKPRKSKKTTHQRRPRNVQSWEDLEPGTLVSGKVVKRLPYGVLVQIPYDIPGKTQGCVLMHDHQKGAMSAKLHVGDMVENARVININRDRSAVNISLLAPSRRSTPQASLQVGDEIQGKVVRLQPYGAFLDIGHKRNALLHISRMSMYKVNDIADHVKVGQVLKVRILKIEGKDIAVSLLSPESDAFVDRRQLQNKRIQLWRQLVNSDNEQDEAHTKQQLLEVDRLLWDLIYQYTDSPKSMEV